MPKIVSIEVDIYCYSLAEQELFFSFFSSIAIRLENGKWGSRFPLTMHEFYQGRVENAHLKLFQQEVRQIAQELSKLPVDYQVWNCENPSIPVPVDQKNVQALHLADCFVTTSGKGFFEVIEMAVQDGLDYKGDVSIEIYPL